MSKTDEMLEILRTELESGKYPLESRFPSEYELADRFSVNKKTANKTVSLLVAEGWLRRGRGGQGTLVRKFRRFPRRHIVFIGNIQHPYIARLAHGVQNAALEDNSLTSLIGPPPEHLSTVLAELDNMKIDGIITLSYGLLSGVRVPVIYLEDQLGEVRYPDFVSCDSYHSGRQMMEELLRRGHRNIVMLFQSQNNPERLHGYYDAMREAGIQDCRERTFRLLEYTVGETNIILSQICKKYPGFTAVAACSDDDIHRMIISMRLRKMEWEGKIAMVGFGNLSGISNVYPIATVDQHPLRIGAAAWHRLLEKIQNPQIRIQEYLDTELVNVHNIPVVQPVPD